MTAPQDFSCLILGSRVMVLVSVLGSEFYLVYQCSMENHVNSPDAGDQLAFTSLTLDPPGPLFKSVSRLSSAFVEPSASTSTLPSCRLRTQPVKPSGLACS